jgi:Co/Zn/Cd efflux system component
MRAEADALGPHGSRIEFVCFEPEGILLVPGLATLWTAWDRFLTPTPPAPLPLTLTGAGALAVNLTCALMLARFRTHSGSLTRASRNDTVGNIAIIVAAALSQRSSNRGRPQL